MSQDRFEADLEDTLAKLDALLDIVDLQLRALRALQARVKVLEEFVTVASKDEIQ